MSRKVAIAHTGPIVAMLNRADRHHAWARDRLDGFSLPILTCEAVVTEACFLVSRLGGRAQVVLDLVSRGFLSLGFSLGDESAIVARMIQRFVDVPMSLADACIVRMSELTPEAVVLTCDSDFRIYRRHGRQIVPVLMPDIA